MDTEQLIERAARGDRGAETELLQRYRPRLKRLAAVRLDRRIARRVDPSDVVQEVLLQAAQKLPEYIQHRPIPFYPWLRQLALEVVITAHRRHLAAERRSVKREVIDSDYLPDRSAVHLALRLLARNNSPSDDAIRKELRHTVREVLAEMPSQDREVLVLRFLEQLPISETASVLGISIDATKSRQRRALERFVRMFDERAGE